MSKKRKKDREREESHSKVLLAIAVINLLIEAIELVTKLIE